MNDMISGIGAAVKLADGIPPAASRSAATVVGSAIDRLGFQSCVVDASCGAAEGTPTSFTLDVKVTHCDTSGGSYTDYTPVSGSAASGAVAQITADSTRKRKSINLSGAKQYIKISSTLAFSGGTSPKLPYAVKVVLGGAVELPAQADD